MLTSLLWRPKWAADPTRTYYALSGVMALCFVLNSTLNLVYMATVVHLDPLQMVLVGTVLEATCFLFEVPTGLVADLYSRRLSVIIGLGLIGGGFLLQGLLPTFAAVIAAQVVWGVGYTFTSGATEAWLTDEIGEDAIGPVFTRRQQIGLVASFVGTVAAGGLGLVTLRLPMLLAGAGLVTLGATMLLVMPERRFTPVPRGQRETLRHMVRSVSAGLSLARRRRVVRSFFLVSLIVGLSSEAFDRLWTVRVLHDFRLPDLLGVHGPVLWFTAFSLIGSLVSLTASLVVNRVTPDRVNALHPHGPLAVLAAVRVLGVLGLALLGTLWLALGAMWLRGAAATVARPVEAAWLNRNLDSRVRATVLSMNGQADAVGQVLGGPPLGELANRTSVSTALSVSALILTPVVLVYARLRPARDAGVSDAADTAGIAPTSAATPG
ncbi:MAG: MFS transporter, partial [Actinocatenispora sp.]